MQQKIKASYENETQSRGLIIIEAYYGKEKHITDLMGQEDKARYHLENNVLDQIFIYKVRNSGCNITIDILGKELLVITI